MRIYNEKILNATENKLNYYAKKRYKGVQQAREIIRDTPVDS